VFDVRRRRIVTNARNYTTFLYQTARAVIRLMPPEQNSVLHYVTVTPFDPYDALNCPHPPLGMGGDSKVSYCFEEGFLGDYFSTFVRELTSAYGDRVHHRRYIIGVADKDAFLGEHPGTQQWNLSRRAQVRRASADAVIDVPFRPTDVTRADVVMKQAKLLKSYAEREHDILHNHLDNYTRELGRVAKEQERHSEDDVVFRLVFDGNALLTLDEVKAMVGNRVAALDESTKRIRAVIAGKVRPVVPSAWASLEEIADTVTETVGPVSQAFLDILTVAQELRVHMPADSIPDLDCLVSQLKHLRSALRFRDEYLVGPQAHVPTLREHFSGKFHTGHGSRDAREFFLDEGTLNRWESDFGRVPPEFALFGLGPKDAEVEVKGAVNWLLALSSTISYPWRSCEVRIVTPDATDRPALNDFEDFLCGFLKDADAY